MTNDNQIRDAIYMGFVFAVRLLTKDNPPTDEEITSLFDISDDGLEKLVEMCKLGALDHD